MDPPHPNPFPGKRRSAAALAAPLKPKPKSVAAAAARTARMAKRSPTANANTNAAPQPRPPRRAFGTVNGSNAPVEKPPPPLKKPLKLSPPKQLKAAKSSPPAMQKPSKQSPPNMVRATKPSRPAARPVKKATVGVDLVARAKKKSQRVSFQEATAVASGSGGKVKASSPVEVIRHTPMTAVKTAEKSGKVAAAETPFFSALNCSSGTLDQLESATYWLAQIHLAESVGKHWVAAAFFRLAFECQAQPIHRIQSELRNYTVRHESASNLTNLFDELLTAHDISVNQPMFDTAGFEKVDTPVATNVLDKNLDTATPKVHEECLKCDCGDDLIDVGAVIVERHGQEGMEQPSFERKLDESFEFDDCEAVIVNQLEEANSDLIQMKVPDSSEVIQSDYRCSIEQLSPRGSIVVKNSSPGVLSLDNALDSRTPSIQSSSAKRLSSSSPFYKKSSLSSKRLTTSCPSYKKSASPRVCFHEEHNATAGGFDHQNKLTQELGSECPALVDQLESSGPVEDSPNNEKPISNWSWRQHSTRRQ
ncbi:hypothetical protein ACP4OV_004759 [Aristida adscensionis]